MADGTRLPVIADGGVPPQIPVFPRVAVFGLDAAGASIGLALRRRWPTVLVIGVDEHDVVETATRMHAIDVGADDPFIAGGADLVVLGGDRDRRAAWGAQLPTWVPGPAVVVMLDADEEPPACAAGWPAPLTLVAGGAVHAGAPGGVELAHPSWFDGRVWRVGAGVPAETAGRVRVFAEALGATAQGGPALAV
jgi:hypothetical protein